MNLKQKEKIYNVQQKFLQYYAKIYLDVIEQSVENNKTFSEIFAPMMNKLIKLEKDSNLRKEEEAKEKKYIKLDGIIIEMPVEEDIPKARFDLKLQPFVINTQKQSFQQNIQQQLSNNPNNNPNLNELVNKLQIKINSRKQSQEKLVLKKKGSQSELIQLLNGNEIDSNTNSNNISQNMIYRSSDLVQQPTTQIIQDNQQDLSQNQSINITLSKQSSQTNYQFQPYAAKPNSRDISPQSNQVRKLKKNFTIAPIQQSTDLLTKSKQKTLSQTNLEEIKDISKNINNEEKKTPLKIVLNKDNVYQLNSNHNKAIPKTYFMDTNSPAKQQLNKAQIFKKQHTLKGTKDLGASPKIHNVQRQIHPTDSNIVGGKNQQSPLSEKKQISETIGQKANVLKMKKNLIEGQRHSIDVQNINQSSCDSLPYIQQNLSSSQLLNSNTHSANITNGFSQILQMTNSQKSKSYNNLSFKNQTEGNEQSSTRMINNTYNQIEKTPINFYQQNTPSLTNIENLNKQNKPINQIYYETTTKSQQQSEQKPINAIQSFSQLQDNSMFHNSNKLHSSIILGYSSPQQDRQSSGIKLKSDRFSDITQKKLTSNKKLIQLQQQQPLNNVQTNNEFSQPNSLINSTNFNKLISSNTAQKIDSSSTIPTINNSKQGSQSKIKGLLESKQEMRNLSNSNSSQKLFSGELSPNVIIKNQMAQQNYYQKIDSPQTKETNFTQQLQQQQQ